MRTLHDFVNASFLMSSSYVTAVGMVDNQTSNFQFASEFVKYLLESPVSDTYCFIVSGNCHILFCPHRKHNYSERDSLLTYDLTNTFYSVIKHYIEPFYIQASDPGDENMALTSRIMASGFSQAAK
jgi:hypothetical protein